ncbi:MAG: hypothetical protein IMF05_08385 [Proteobacteria bacterium]|nr:hypothetical protein [Pseudomonadota bacterium]
MTNAVWIIMYELQRARAAEYLEWFHDVHIPEKLARPGYDWASHYQVLRDGDEASSDDGDLACIALFGGRATSVFYNPSPAQLKPTQSAETRDMMTCRKNSRSLILSGEWAVDGHGVANESKPAIDAEMIAVALCDVAGNDEDFGAWLVQGHLESIARDQGCTGVRKFLASTGGAKHAIFHERSNPAAAPLVFADTEVDEWTARVKEYVSHPLGAPKTARRLWSARS